MTSTQNTPKLSIIVIGYKMAKQLVNTLYTLSEDYQQNVSAKDYEVIVVENDSTDTLDATTISKLPDNFRYYLRKELGVSPVPAINFGFEQCYAPVVGLILDGARMISPGVIYHTLQSQRLDGRVITIVPGYHLGDQEQHLSSSQQYNETKENELLSSIDWRNNGYELFRVASFSGANIRGYLQPMMECNCMFAPAECFQTIGYADSQFTLKGGGSVNLHIYRSLGMLPGSRLVVLPGEGSFHQYHGGVTTSSYAGLQAELATHKKQLHSLWNGQFHSLRRNPTLMGEISAQAQPFLTLSTTFAEKRLQRFNSINQPAWPDDVALQTI